MSPLGRRCSAGALAALAGLAWVGIFLGGTAAPPEAAAEVATRAAAARTHTGPGRRLTVNSGCHGCYSSFFLAKYLSTDPPPKPPERIHRKPLPMHARPAEREALNSRIVQRAVTNSRLAEARVHHAQIASSAKPASSARIQAEHHHPHHNRTSPGTVGTLVHLPAAPTGPPRGRYDGSAAAAAWVSSEPVRSRGIRLHGSINGTSGLRHESEG